MTDLPLYCVAQRCEARSLRGQTLPSAERMITRSFAKITHFTAGSGLKICFGASPYHFQSRGFDIETM